MKRTFILSSLILLVVLAVSVSCADLKVIVEADTFVKEEGGTVEILEGRTEATGNKSIRNWDFQIGRASWWVRV